MNRQNLLNRLSDGQWHSGQHLASVLGLSRAGIWKQIESLRGLGVSVEANKVKGYRLSKPFLLLDKTEIKEALSFEYARIIKTIDCHLECESTNDIGLGLLKEGVDQFVERLSIVIAERQTKGRGRRGRHWLGVYGQSIALSYVTAFQKGGSTLSGLSLVVAIAVVEALNKLGWSDIGVKWPNDIVVGDSKLGGILIELVGDLAGPCGVVIGIGINVGVSPDSGQVEDKKCIDLGSLPNGDSVISLDRVNRNIIISTITITLWEALNEFNRHGFSAFQNRWLNLDVMYNQDVVLSNESQHICGLSKGVDEKGMLVLDMAGVINTFDIGELSLRKKLHD